MPLTGFRIRLTQGSTPAITPAAALAMSSGESAATNTMRLLDQFIGEGRLLVASSSVFQSENLLVRRPPTLLMPPIGSMATPIRGRMPPPPASFGEAVSTWVRRAVMLSGVVLDERQTMLICRWEKAVNAAVGSTGSCAGSRL